MTETICEALRNGLSIEGACARGGIAPSTYHEWAARGAKGDDHYSEFSEQTARARAQVEERLLESVEWAAGERIRLRALGGGDDAEIVEEVQRDWRAAAWLLERKFPGEYSNRQKVEHSGVVGAAVEMDLGKDAEAAARAFLAKVTGDDVDDG